MSAEIESVEVVYSAPMHCVGPKDLSDLSDARLTIRTADGGGGFYVVVTAHEWAIDPLEGETQIQAIERIARLLGA